MVRVAAHPLLVAVALGLLGPAALTDGARLELPATRPEPEPDRDGPEPSGDADHV
jgi:hypothetical protein